MTKKILIAGDQVTRTRLTELIQGHGYWEVCARAENGQKAVLKATELKPDIIILDLTMPVMDGLSAAREIGKILPSTPIVLYTHQRFASTELEAKKAGIRKVVAKPGTDALFGAIEELLWIGPQGASQGKKGGGTPASVRLNLTGTVAPACQPIGTTESDPGESDPTVKSN